MEYVLLQEGGIAERIRPEHPSPQRSFLDHVLMETLLSNVQRPIGHIEMTRIDLNPDPESSPDRSTPTLNEPEPDPTPASDRSTSTPSESRPGPPPTSDRSTPTPNERESQLAQFNEFEIQNRDRIAQLLSSRVPEGAIDQALRTLDEAMRLVRESISEPQRFEERVRARGRQVLESRRRT